jgi:hypothetical protein
MRTSARALLFLDPPLDFCCVRTNEIEFSLKLGKLFRNVRFFSRLEAKYTASPEIPPLSNAPRIANRTFIVKRRVPLTQAINKSFFKYRSLGVEGLFRWRFALGVCEIRQDRPKFL